MILRSINSNTAVKYNDTAVAVRRETMRKNYVERAMLRRLKKHIKISEDNFTIFSATQLHAINSRQIDAVAPR